MFKKIGASFLAALMLSTVAFAGDFAPTGDGEDKQEIKQEERKVLKFDKEVVKKVMMEDGMNDYSANLMIAGYAASYDSRMQNTLDSYVADRTISEEVIDGISIKKVMDKHKNTFWNAFLLMDAYLRDPKGAEQLDNYGTIKADQEEIDSLFKNNKAKGE